MANYCRFCGKELENGTCDCGEFQNGAAYESEYQNQGMKEKTPFWVTNIQLDFSSISNFFTSLRNQMGVGESCNGTSDAYEHNIPIVPNCIEAEDNEIVVKQYNIAKLRTRLKFMKAEGRLQVTNRRILFRAAGTSLTGNTLQEHQFNIDELAGIEMHKDYKFSILSFLGCCLLNYWVFLLTAGILVGIFGYRSNTGPMLMGILLGILGIVPTFLIYKRFWLKLLAAIISAGGFALAYGIHNNGFLAFLLFISQIIVLINLVIVCFVPNLVIKLKTKGATGAIVIGSQKAMFRRKTGDDYSGFAEVMPWEDTVAAMNELGTMLDDLQKLGDYAIEKWTS